MSNPYSQMHQDSTVQDEKRALALSLAGEDADANTKPELVIKRAELYLKFLMGENSEAEVLPFKQVAD